MFRIKRHIKDEAGVTSTEMVFAMSLFLFIFFWTIETGLIMMRWVMLERAVDITARELRLQGIPATAYANPANPTNTEAHEYVKTRICENTELIQNCANDLFLELAEVDVNTGIPNTAATCIDRTNTVNPLLGIPVVDEGERPVANARDVMYLRACVVVDPILPANYAMPLKYDPSGGVALVVDSAYVNEP